MLPTLEIIMMIKSQKIPVLTSKWYLGCFVMPRHDNTRITALCFKTTGSWYLNRNLGFFQQFQIATTRQWSNLWKWHYFVVGQISWDEASSQDRWSSINSVNWPTQAMTNTLTDPLNNPLTVGVKRVLDSWCYVEIPWMYFPEITRQHCRLPILEQACLKITNSRSSWN